MWGEKPSNRGIKLKGARRIGKRFIPDIGEIRLTRKSLHLRFNQFHSWIWGYRSFLDSDDYCGYFDIPFGMPFTGDQSIAHIPFSVDFKRKVKLVSFD